MPYGDRTPTVSELIVQVAQLKAQLAAARAAATRSAAEAPSPVELARVWRLLDAFARQLDADQRIDARAAPDGRPLADEIRDLAALLQRCLPSDARTR